MTAADYLVQLQALLPHGLAWPRASDATLTRLLGAWADDLARADQRAADLLAESDPRLTSEILLDWERVAGLPDPCVALAGVEQTTEQRRAALVAKLTSLGGQSRQYFIDLAAALGYPGATIDEYRTMKCNSNCNDALWSIEDRFVWLLNLPSDGGTFIMNCDSPCDSALASWGDEAIECRVQKLKPAHTTALVAYV